MGIFFHNFSQFQHWCHGLGGPNLAWICYLTSHPVIKLKIQESLQAFAWFIQNHMFTWAGFLSVLTCVNSPSVHTNVLQMMATIRLWMAPLAMKPTQWAAKSVPWKTMRAEWVWDNPEVRQSLCTVVMGGNKRTLCSTLPYFLFCLEPHESVQVTQI